MLGVQSIWSSSDNAFKTYGFGQWDGSHNVGYTTGNPPSNQSMNYGQVLTYADQSGAQTNNLRNTINAAVYTGSGGMMYLTSGGGIYRGTLSTNMATLKATTAESSGTFKSLNDGVGNYVVGNTGTLLQKSSTWQTIPLYTSGTTLCLNNLFGVAVDSYGHVVVVGDKGTIFSNGTSSWVYIQPTDINGTVITSALRSVAWGNGYWIAVGDKGVILKSTDGSTWQQINNDYLSQNDLSSRNLNVVTYNASTHTFSIGGDGTLFLTSGDSDPSFSLCATPTRDTGSTSGTMTRMYYKGSNSDPKNNTAVPIAQQITSNTNPSTTISSTIIDTDYEKGEALSYYLVVGNMDGDNNYLHPVVYASSGVITATEYKK
jgi:hypothetical protein